MVEDLIQVLRCLKEVFLQAEKQLESLSSSENEVYFKGWDAARDLKLLVTRLQSCKTSRDTIEDKFRQRYNLEEEEENQAIFELLLNIEESHANDPLGSTLECSNTSCPPDSDRDSDDQGDNTGKQIFKVHSTPTVQMETASSSTDSDRPDGTKSKLHDKIDERLNPNYSESDTELDPIGANSPEIESDTSDTDYIKSEHSSASEFESDDDFGCKKSTKKVAKLELDSDEINESSCDQCGKEFRFPSWKKRHRCSQSSKSLSKENKIESIEPEQETTVCVNCPICEANVSAESLEKHIQDDHGYSNLAQLKKTFSHYNIPVQCSKCEKWLRNAGMVSYHKRSKCETLKGYAKIMREAKSKKRSGLNLENNDDPIECNVCYDKILPTDIKQHYKSAHGKRIDKNLTECIKCGEAMSTKTLSWHLRRNCGKKGGKPIPTANEDFVECEICQRKVRISNLDKHIQYSHEKEATFQCNQCPKKFKNKCHLVKHSKTHFQTKEHVCEICGWSFHERGNLLQHMKKHSEDRPLKCDKCDATFKFVQSLKSHVDAIHSEVCVQCSECGKLFTTKARLKKHVDSIHLRLRPHSCHLCGKAFKRGEHLKYHVRTHSNPNSKQRGLNKDKMESI